MFPLHLLCSGSGPVSFSLESDNAVGHGNRRRIRQTRVRRSHSAADLGVEESRPSFPPKLVRSNSMPPSRRKRQQTDRWASSSKLSNRWESSCDQNETSYKKLGGDSPPVLPRGDRNARMPSRRFSPPMDADFTGVCSRAA